MATPTAEKALHEDDVWLVDPQWPRAVLEEARAMYRVALEDDEVCSNILTNGFATMGGEMPKLAAYKRRVAFDHEVSKVKAIWAKYEGEPLHTRWIEVVARCVVLESEWEGVAPSRPDFVAIVQRWLETDGDTARELVRLANEYEHGARFQRFWLELRNCRAIGVRRQIEEAGL